MLSELQNDSSAEPRMPKSRQPVSFQKLFLGALLVLLGGAAIFNGVSRISYNAIRLIAPNGYITAEVMDTNELRAKGLSGRDSLKESEGMLFLFETASAEHCFWMKDMKFSIDMVWMNDQKEVVTVTPGVSPDTYPDTFCPDMPAKYGLELASGRAVSLGITSGSKLRW